MADEDYELIPHQLLNDLRYDVEALKKKLNQPDTKINELLLEVESLKDSIHDLNLIFQKAIEETKDEDPSQKIQKLNERIDEVINQNETIAKGMIAIADKLESFMNSQQQQSSKVMMAPPSLSPTQHNMGLPSLPGNRIAPPPMGGMGSPEGNFGSSPDFDMPPPPPRMKGDKKRSLNGMF